MHNVTFFHPVQFDWTYEEIKANPSLLEGFSMMAVAIESMEVEEGVWLDVFGYTKDGEEIFAGYDYDPISEEMRAYPSFDKYDVLFN